MELSFFGLMNAQLVQCQREDDKDILQLCRAINKGLFRGTDGRKKFMRK